MTRLFSLLFVFVLPAYGQDALQSVDVGPGTGTTTTAGDTLVVTSTGADVWGTSDDFRFVYRALEGDAEVEAEVVAYEGPSEWGKAGVMLRDGLGAGRPFVDLVRTRDNGLEMQFRSAPGAAVETAETAREVAGLPVRLRLVREGSRVTAYYRMAGGDGWTELARLESALPAAVQAGLAVTSGGGGTGRATFAEPVVRPFVCVPVPPVLTLPDVALFAGDTLAVDLAAATDVNTCSGEVTYGRIAGPGAVTGGRYEWVPETPGTFQVTLSARNDAGRTTASFEATVRRRPVALSPLHVEGNRIVNAEGERVILRGVAVADVSRLNTIRPGQSAASIMERAAVEFGARVIRLTVTPGDYFANPEAYLRDHLDPAVDKGAELGVYVIVDLHYVSNGTPGYDPRYTELDDEVRAFWNAVAPRYAGLPHVIYELFNEPAEPSAWATWKSYAQPWVDLVRFHADNLLLVSGTVWSSNIAPALDDPFEGEDLVYVAHVYPDQAGYTNPNPEAVWERNWGVVAETYPVIVTEWGYENVPGHHWSGGTQTNYGEPLQAYIEAKGLSWTAWCFDHSWGPKMFDAGWNILSGDDFHGQFVKDWLQFHAEGPRPVIWVDRDELDFGINAAGQQQTRSFRVANTGEGPLELTFTSTHPDFVVEGAGEESTVVAVGDTAEVTVRFLSRGGGLQRGTLRVEHNAIGGVREVAVFGLSRGDPVDVEAGEEPASFGLSPNYPNPFNPGTTIPYGVGREARVRLTVYDAVGREVAVLVDGRRAPGYYTAQFHAEALASGLYLAELRADGRRVDARLLHLLK